MLRGARPLLSSSVRAIGARAAHHWTLSNVTRPAATAGVVSSTQTPSRACPRPLSGHHVILSRVSFATKIPEEEREHEKEVAKQKLRSEPEKVTVDSSVRKIFEPPTANDDQVGVFKGVKSDLQTVKSTFDLSAVPRDAYRLGLAGTLPYLATSLSTLYLGWNIRTPWPTSSNILNSFMMSNETAEYLISLIEPIQLGYGAVLISFIGAIHWGLELAEKSSAPGRTKLRYRMGVVAPLVAWPTLMMPFEYALVTQFAAFTGLYFVDARAATRGWAPPWYGTYRFVLTFVVGSAIAISFLGRSKAEGESFGMRHATEKLVEVKQPGAGGVMPEATWKRLEAEEKERIRKEKEEAEKKKREEEEAAKKEEKGKGSKNKSGDDDQSTTAAGAKEGKPGKKAKRNDDKPADDGEKKNEDGEEEIKDDKGGDGEGKSGKKSKGKN